MGDGADQIGPDADRPQRRRGLLTHRGDLGRAEHASVAIAHRPTEGGHRGPAGEEHPVVARGVGDGPLERRRVGRGLDGEGRCRQRLRRGVPQVDDRLSRPPGRARDEHALAEEGPGIEEA